MSDKIQTTGPITTWHCSQCGNTDAEDASPFNPDLEGYSGCCNEPIVTRCSSTTCSH